MRAWGFATVLGGDRPVSRTADPPCCSSTSAGANEAPLPARDGASFNAQPLDFRARQAHGQGGARGGRVQ